MPRPRPSLRVRMRCDHTWWVRTRSVTGFPCESRIVIRRTVRTPGREVAAGVRVTRSPASCAEIGGVSVVSITDMAGRIGMPMPSVQASSPFMPWLAVSVRLAQVNTVPRVRASAATVARKP